MGLRPFTGIRDLKFFFMDQILSVSQYLSLVNKTLSVLEEVAVEGEVSDFRISRDKWVSFKLKDQKDEAVVECFMVIFKLHVPLEDGMLVRVWGRPRVYAKYGKFSISVAHIELAGEGSLKRAFEITKAKLEAEGLFDQARKRSLPEFPQNIGLITSGEAAAYSDFIKILGERFGGLTLHFIDIHVQGKQAPSQIAAAFNYFADCWRELALDVIILVRGGGSLEDLQSFNDEMVARAVFRSPVPVVVGVGHERDITLADYVADVRASTPSNAAELLVPSRDEVKQELDSQLRNIEVEIMERIREGQVLADEAMHMGERCLSGIRQEVKTELHLLGANIRDIAHTFSLNRQNVGYFTQNFAVNLVSWLAFLKKELGRELGLLESYNPRAVLKRGYSIVRLIPSRSVVKSALTLRRDDRIEVELAKGGFEGKVENVKK